MSLIVSRTTAVSRNTCVLLFTCVATFLLLFQQGAVVNSDGASMLAVARSLVYHHSVAVPASFGTLGRDHAYYSVYGIGMTIVSLPAMWIAHAAGLLVGHEDALSTFLAASTQPLIVATLAVVLFRLAKRLGAQDRWALVIAAGAVLCTYELPYGKDYFSEPLTALGITLMIERLLANRPLDAGAALSMSIITRPQALFLVPIAVMILVLDKRYRHAVWFAVPVLVGVLIVAGYNFLRFESPFESGYREAGFTTPITVGLTGLFLSPAKSVLLFAPVILLVPLGLVRMFRVSSLGMWLILASFGGTLVIAATWFSWQGGWSWGPRLLLSGLLPAFAALALLRSRLEKWVATALFAVGFVFSASTLLVPVQAQQLDQPVPRDGPAIVRQYELLPSTMDYTVAHAFDRQQDHPGVHRRYLALWQVEVTRELGRRGLLVDAVATALLLLAVVWSVANLAKRVLPPGGQSTASQQESRASPAEA